MQPGETLDRGLSLVLKQQREMSVPTDAAAVLAAVTVVASIISYRYNMDTSNLNHIPQSVGIFPYIFNHIQSVNNIITHSSRFPFKMSRQLVPKSLLWKLRLGRILVRQTVIPHKACFAFEYVFFFCMWFNAIYFLLGEDHFTINLELRVFLYQDLQKQIWAIQILPGCCVNLPCNCLGWVPMKV